MTDREFEAIDAWALKHPLTLIGEELKAYDEEVDNEYKQRCYELIHLREAKDYIAKVHPETSKYVVELVEMGLAIAERNFPKETERFHKEKQRIHFAKYPPIAI